jgi:hypothetical protein
MYAQENIKFSELSGAYLGQRPPGLVPEVFAQGIISTPDKLEGCSGFIDEGEVFIYSQMEPGTDWKQHKITNVTKYDGSSWSEPVPVPFNHLIPYNFTVAPDDSTLYFTSLRDPDNPEEILEQSNIWKVSKTIDGWTEPRILGADINTPDYYENYPAITSDNTIYFMAWYDGGIGRVDIYASRLGENGKYLPPKNVGEVINTEESDQDPFIAPDESYLIVCLKEPDGYGEYDLYVSFRVDDSWSEPVNMGDEINTADFEFRPSVTPDGKYFFFTRGNGDPDWGDIYWVDAKIIEQLKPSKSNR